MEISVLIDEGFRRKVTKRWLRGIAEKVLTIQGAGNSVELGLVIASGERVRELNRQYRGKDEPTDVLAFSAKEEVGTDFPFAQPPDGLVHLGEVIISYPQAVTQAEEYKHPVKRELATLITHGILHLLGYEHDRPEPERRMMAKEAEIMVALKEEGLEGPGHCR